MTDPGLADERDHLLASLDDLEVEYEAGDLDVVDYEVLKADYTARAAAVIRRLDGEADVVSDAERADQAGNGRGWWWVVG